MKLDPVFGIENSRWYSLMKCGLACRNAKQDAADIIKHSRNLGKLGGYEPTAGKELADAENNLTEALFAIKIARQEYEHITNPKLAAAE